ncbi:MAG TPA: DUF4139 domain-containing protein [Planctomycetota bacterium]|nr:DUF4139 domain-containing protein [Planctomycetota bacterium]
MRSASAFIAVALLSMTAFGQDQAAQPLKVRKIVVYKHGVGYFEREGKVTGDQQVALTFKTAQMKDLLKSLYAVDLNGGRIATISYDTKDPLSKQLEDILIQIPEENTLTQFLTQLKGARIEATLAGEKITGSVVGIEPIHKQTKDGTITSYKLVLYAEGGKIQPIDLLEAQSLKLLDEGLQKDLARVLDIHLKAKYADRKSVVLNATGQGERAVRVGYIIETPIWKTSYRLLFADNDKPLLQGWAILENTTDEDWDQVDVSFVAGSPMSFVMDLYTAYYPQRAEIPVGVTAAPKPEPMAMAEKAAAAKMPAAPGAAMGGRGRLAADALKKGDFGADREEGLARREMRKNLAEELESAVAPAMAGVEVGDLFAYQSREKVSVKRGQAALVPILSERVDGGERILFYRGSVSSKPMNSYYFKNSTGLTLEAGPVTVFDGSTCVGEGLMRKVLKKDMKDMIPYAVEAGVSIDRKVNQRSDPVTKGSIANGVLTLTYTQNFESAYSIRSQIGKDTVLYLDHPRAGGFKLAEPAKAEEEVDNHYRFRIEVKAGQTAEFKVRETMPASSTISLLGTPAETIRFYLQQRYLTESARAFLAQLIATQGEIGRLRQRENELAAERARITEDETRTRQNLGVLRDTPAELELRKKYLAQLEKSEARLEQTRDEAKQSTAARQQLEAELGKKVQEFRDE